MWNLCYIVILYQYDFMLYIVFVCMAWNRIICYYYFSLLYQIPFLFCSSSNKRLSLCSVLHSRHSFLTLWMLYLLVLYYQFSHNPFYHFMDIQNHSVVVLYFIECMDGLAWLLYSYFLPAFSGCIICMEFPTFTSLCLR